MIAGIVYDMMSRSLRVSNRRFKAVSSWQPLVPDAPVGWAHIGAESRAAMLAWTREDISCTIWKEIGDYPHEYQRVS